MKKLMFLSFASAALFLASCGSNNSNNGGDSAATTEASSDAGSDSAATPAASATNDIPGLDQVQSSQDIAITGDDQMKYDKTLFKVKAGQPVNLSFKNVGKMPAASMSHDVVVLKVGSDLASFGQAAGAAKNHDLKTLPASLQAEIVADTKMLGPGESDKITFTLPAAGVYPFLCTFPGHYAVMQGKIVAE